VLLAELDLSSVELVTVVKPTRLSSLPVTHHSKVLTIPANGITRKQDKLIKSALLQFTEETHRKL